MPKTKLTPQEQWIVDYLKGIKEWIKPTEIGQAYDNDRGSAQPAGRTAGNTNVKGVFMSKEKLRKELINLLVDVEDANAGTGTIDNREVSDRLRVILAKMQNIN